MSKAFQEMEMEIPNSASVPNPSGCIHILGVGNLGRLFAHALAKSKNPPPISLLLHRASLLSEWEKGGRQISITTDGTVNSQASFSVEVIDPSHPPPSQDSIIENLIIATKATTTLSALSALNHRLNSTSTILFTQNGMGTVDEVTAHIFPSISSRPTFLSCITSHGVFTQGPFNSVHAGFGSVSIGRTHQVPPPPPPNLSSNAQNLIDRIVGAPLLNAREVAPRDLLLLQLEKLAVNAMINPLTAIFHCRNGELFDKGPIVALMRLLLAEVSQVIRSLPEIREDEETESRFSTRNLEGVVLDVADKTGKNTSSMLQDVRAQKETEIEYINGYVVKRGRELGVDCEHNEKLVEMVKTGKRIGLDEIREHFAVLGR